MWGCVVGKGKRPQERGCKCGSVQPGWLRRVPYMLKFETGTERNGMGSTTNAMQVMLVTPFPHLVSAVALQMACDAKVLQLVRLPLRKRVPSWAG